MDPIKITVCLVRIGGRICNRVFFVKNAAIKWAKSHACGKPWEVSEFKEIQTLAKGVE